MSKLRESSQSAVYSNIVDSLESGWIIKVHNATDTFNNNLMKSLSGYRKAGSLFEVNRLIPKTVVDLLVFFILVGMMILSDQDTSSMSEFAMYGVVAYRMIPIVNKLFTIFMSIRFYLPSIDIVYDIMMSHKQIDGGGNYRVSVDKPSVIKMKDISFSYNKSRKVLNKINLTFKRGFVNVIIGKSGSGKSTLINLLLGVLVPDSGNIQIDGKYTTKDLLIKDFNVSFVSQSASIFNLPVYSNITMQFDKKKVDFKRLYSSIDMVGLTEYVNNLEDGIYTILNR